MPLFRSLCLVTTLLLAGTTMAATPPEFTKGVHAFISEMAERHGMNKDWLAKVVGGAEYRQSIIDAMTRPAEGKPWYEYRRIFLTPQRIEGGVDFWEENRALLERAEREYGVAIEAIVAIIGVETRYGANTGSYRVVDALATLAFGYPPRAEFFRAELEQLLLLAQEERLDPTELEGSYAGAMGMPQFIPSSYRRYAVDFDLDGRRDLLHSTADAIGSVAAYLHHFGWQKGEGVTTMAEGVDPVRHQNYLDGGIEPSIRVDTLNDAGIVARQQLRGEERVSLFSLQAEGGDEYWLGQNNFYVITRYNHSRLYAMAVHQLGQAIARLRGERSQQHGID